MGVKLHEYENAVSGRLFVFHCPGCGYSHPFHTVGDPAIRPQWAWNGSMDAPTFTPSLGVFMTEPAMRCHSFVTDGRIQFLADSHHKLAGQTVDLPDWED